MQRGWARRARSARRLTLSAVALGAFMGVGGCFHVSQRALANGRTLSYNGTEGSLLYGDHDLGSQRRTFYRADAYRAHYRQVPFPYFGHW